MDLQPALQVKPTGFLLMVESSSECFLNNSIWNVGNETFNICSNFK